MLADACTFEAIAGPHQGKRIELAGDRMMIGRASDNDIVVNAEGVSRQHAMLVFSQGAWFIRDNGSKNGLIVNGETLRESWLENGDTIQIGGALFRFNAPKAVDPVESPASSEEMSMQVSTGRPRSAPSKRPLIYGGVGLLLVALYFMTSGTPSTTSTETAETEAGKLARDFDTGQPPDLTTNPKGSKITGLEDPVLKKAEQEMSKLDWTNAALKESEQFFRRGQREYLNKNYHRAIEAFQTSLALYRGHMLADRYLRRAVYEVEIEAKQNMDAGVRYFDALQYQRAIYHFSEVITLMSHRPNEKISAEAERYIQQAKKRLQAAELFP